MNTPCYDDLELGESEECAERYYGKSQVDTTDGDNNGRGTKTTLYQKLGDNNEEMKQRSHNKMKQTAGDADKELAGNGGGDVQQRTEGKKMQAGGDTDDADGPTVRPHICGIISCGGVG